MYNRYIENAHAGFYVTSIGDKRPAFLLFGAGGFGSVPRLRVIQLKLKDVTWSVRKG